MIDYNDELIPDDRACISLNNRGYNYGDALFETLRVINGEVMFWEDHYFRLMAGMRILRMEIPMSFSPEYLEERIRRVVCKNGLDRKPAKVKLNIHRKQGGLYKPNSRQIGYVIRAEEIDNSFYIIDSDPYEIELFKDHYVQSGLLATLKSNNRLVNILGSIYAEENSFANCLLLNEKKSVVEALNGNLFWVKDNQIKTPPLEEGCLNGIIRKKLIEIIKKTDFDLQEVKLSPFELQKADELLITNSISGIIPVGRYRKKQYGNTVAKSLLAKLNTLARIEGKQMRSESQQDLSI